MVGKHPQIISVVALLLGMAVVGVAWFVASATGESSDPEVVTLWLLIQEERPPQPDTARDGDGCSFDTQPWNQVVIRDLDTVVGAFQPTDGKLEHTSATDTWHCDRLVSLDLQLPEHGSGYTVIANGEDVARIMPDEIGKAGIPITWISQSDHTPIASPIASPQTASVASGMERGR